MDREYTSQPAFAVVETCPDCGRRLRVQHRRADGQPFVGCSGFPACRFVANYEEREQALAARMVELEDAIADHDCGATLMPPDALEKELRELVVLSHPDRWPGSETLAHEVTARLTDLRRRLAS